MIAVLSVIGFALGGDDYQDLNCNGIAYEDEGALPFDDIDCVANADTRPNRDYYYDVDDYGCAYPVDGLDPDADGWGYGTIKGAGFTVELTCDTCPDVYDPYHLDADGDGHGDECDICPDAADPDRLDTDGDGLGDECDLCPEDVDKVKADTDDDGFGDSCDNCPADPNPTQDDDDGDGLGDYCDCASTDASQPGKDGDCNDDTGTTAEADTDTDTDADSNTDADTATDVDTDTDAGGDTAVTAIDDGAEEPGGCGCDAGGAVGVWPCAAVLMAFVRQRRAHLVEPKPRSPVHPGTAEGARNLLRRGHRTRL